MCFRSIAILASFVLGYFILEEEVTAKRVVNMFVVIGGLTLVLQPWKQDEVTLPRQQHNDTLSLWEQEQGLSSWQQQNFNISVLNNTLIMPNMRDSTLWNNDYLLNHTNNASNSTIRKLWLNNSTTMTDTLRQPINISIGGLVFGYILAMLAGIGNAFGTTIQKKYCPHISADVLTFYVCSGGLLLSGIIMLMFEQPMWPNDLYDLIWLFIHSTSIGLSQLLACKSRLLMPQIIYYITSSTFIMFSLLGQYTLLSQVNPGYRNTEKRTQFKTIGFFSASWAYPLFTYLQ